jgi:hypothetical protein
MGGNYAYAKCHTSTSIKEKMKQTFNFILLIILSSCSSIEKEQSIHETLYNNVADSLKVYRDDINKATGIKDTMRQDLMTLSYDLFRSKYDLSEMEVDLIASQYQITVDIGKAFKAIDENISKATSINLNLDSTKEVPDYRFRENQSTRNIKPENDTNAINALMNAYDSEVKAAPIKK